MTPSLSASTPLSARPASTAASRNSPDARGSRPTTATGRPGPTGPEPPRPKPTGPEPTRPAPGSPPSTWAAAAARLMARRASRSRPATPRTPSVPNSPMNGRPQNQRWLALGVLRCLTCLLQACLLALLDPGVPGEEPQALQGRTACRVDEYECPGNSQPQRARLAGYAATGDPCHDIELTICPKGYERLADELLMHLVREVGVQCAAVDQELPGTRHHPHPGDCLLAAAGAECVTCDHRPARRGLDRGANRLAGLGGVLRDVLGVVVD